MKLKATAAVFAVALIAVIGLNSIDSSTTGFEPGEGVDTFESEEEFRAYLDAAESSSSASYSRTQDLAAETDYERLDADDTPAETAEMQEELADDSGGVVEPERVLTDDENIYYSSRYPKHLHVVGLDLGLEHNESGIGGDLFQTDEQLLTVDGNITSYMKQELVKDWGVEPESRIETVRKSGDTLTVVTREGIDYMNPCPVRPMEGVEIGCGSIYYPGNPTDVDHTYNIMKLDVETGEVRESVAFTGSRSTEVEVTSENVYVSFSERVPESDVLMEGLLQSGIIDSELEQRLEEIDGYTLTERSRMNEIEAAVKSFEEREDEEAMESIEEELTRFDGENMRGYETSHLLRFDQGLEKDELEFEGRITEISAEQDSVTLVSRIEGFDRSNREHDIHRLEGFEPESSRTGFEDSNIREVVLEEERTLVSTWDGWKVLGPELETVERLEVDSLERVGDGYLVTERVDREGVLKLLDSEFNERSRLELENRWLYSMESPVRFDGRFLVPVRGGNSSIIEFYPEEGRLSQVEISSSPQRLVTAGENLYVIERDGIVLKDGEYRVENSVELHRERPDYVRPMEEPAIR